jgi:hypothetical protein
MQQMVAVSDAKNRPEHEFARVWDTPEEKADVTAKLEEVARAKLAEYGDVRTPPVVAAAPAAAPAPKPTAPMTAAARAKAKKAAAAAAAAPPPPPPPVPLNDESLRAFTLSYGGAATFVYLATAWTTDSAHLDRQPWMRLVDAVDADASNRASLLFEERGQTSRQFSLYRVIGAKAEQLFATDSQ